jgi:nicotinate-nucleotide adenylyltransferase
MRQGLLGGTFDPIHNGHLEIAEVVRARLKLDEVVFMPAGSPRFKENNPTPAAHRTEMVRRAISGRPYFRLSTLEIERVGPTYTVDTITELGAQLTSRDRIYFILGWDSLIEFPRWREPNRIIEHCFLVAVPRSGVPRPDLDVLEILVPGMAERVIVLDTPVVDISASSVRRQVGQGEPIDQLVPGAVADYIKEQGLYLSET